MRKIFTSLMLLASAVTAMATDYQGTLTVVINGFVAQPTTNQITLNDQTDGKYELTLKNFVLMQDDEPMPIGNIVLQNINAVDEEGAKVLETKQDITLQEGNLEGVDMWMGPMLGEVPVDLRAVVSGDGSILTADIKIPLVGQDVQVKFDSRTFQLPNSGFEEFHTATAGKATSDEPNNWHSFMSCTGNFASFVKGNIHTFISKEIRPGSTGTNSVLVKSVNATLAVANGTLTTGQLKAGGMTAASKSNNAFIDFGNTAKDANGDPFYTVLNTLPDSISVWVKFKQATPVSAHPYATMTAVITDGSYYQEPQDKDYTDIIVGEARNATIAETDGEWKKITVPFTYNNNGKSPKGILVTFSTNADPGQGSVGDELYLDDVELIYSSYLSDLSVNGTTIQGFASDKYDYEYNVEKGATVDELISKVAYTVAGNEAHGIVSVTENVMTITVLSADLLSSHTYTITFTGASDDDNKGNGDDDNKGNGDDDNKGNGDDDNKGNGDDDNKGNGDDDNKGNGDDD
ncbi:MAG: PCMD domain-containing protein, partial [Prevotellaceae bacterium]|nr:PCMD domain-containing protein [Prevotellaceae bacterium]